MNRIKIISGFDDVFLAGSSVSFFMEATETSSAMLSFALYELADNPHCQHKLFEEITAIRAKHNGQITYECLQEMHYLESVLLEALRMHPPLMVLSKVCTEEYTLPKTSTQSKPVTIQAGTPVNIPLLAIHT